MNTYMGLEKYMDTKKQKNEKYKYRPGHTLPFGVSEVEEGVQFSICLPGVRECYLLLYRKGQKRLAARICLSERYMRGSVRSIVFTEIEGNKDPHAVAAVLSEQYEYLYEADGRKVTDPFAACIRGREKWGRRTNASEDTSLRGVITLEEYDWEEEFPLRIPYHESILYQLHIRGFTKHSSSGVRHKGTFAGLQEKIPYLKELGVNGVLLLPCYEFDEIQSRQTQALGRPQNVPETVRQSTVHSSIDEKNTTVRINYWGYGGSHTFYMAPKASYASDPLHPVHEMKDMIHAMHQAGIEVLLDIYFSPGMNVWDMSDCLRRWILEYHIDGFRVNQEVIPSLNLVSDPVLSGVKILASYWDEQVMGQAGILRQENALAEYNEGFMNTARRFLKSDEGQVEAFANCFRRNPSSHAVINFMTYVNGFTMMDLVSYDVKHNDENGEMNQDGTQYNYSWNCGVEGKTRKKTVLARRMCQMRNAFLMMLLSQGTPMLLAGDEFGNTQNGNNNPYCQDNLTTWLDWRKLETHREIWEYVHKLIRFRKAHPVLHPEQELRLFDVKSCGMPDLSIHGTQAWRADFSYYSRMLGMLYYGEYAQKENGETDDSVYIIFNMYWEARSFDLPNLPQDKEWYPVIETYDNTFCETLPAVPKKKRVHKPALESRKKTVVPPRSIVVFLGR